MNKSRLYFFVYVKKFKSHTKKCTGNINSAGEFLSDDICLRILHRMIWYEQNIYLMP